MKSETAAERAKRILKELQTKYPGKNCFDVDGSSQHFACEVEPTEEHPEYDRAIEVIIQTKPHKHLRAAQRYTVLNGTLELHVNDRVVVLGQGNSHTIPPGAVHWSRSDGECWVEEYTTPGWTLDDHIPVDES